MLVRHDNRRAKGTPVERRSKISWHFALDLPSNTQTEAMTRWQHTLDRQSGSLPDIHSM
jgi:hypothetical protein